MQFSYPLPADDQAALSLLLRRGLGRAVLSVRSDYVPERDRATILWHATHHDVLDRQTEPRRGLLLADVITATGEAAFFAQELAAILRAPAEDIDQDTVFDAAWRLAKAGVPGLREAMYEAFARNVSAGDMTGVEEIVYLDREAGVRFTARLQRKSPLALEEDDGYERYRVLYAVEDAFGKDAAPLVLDRLTAGRDPVATFLRQLRGKKEKTGRAPFRSPSGPVTYEAICMAIDDCVAAGKRYLPLNLSRRMDAETSALLADDLRSEADDRRLLLLVRLFGGRRMTGDFSRLEALTESADTVLAWHAVLALARIRDDSIRRRGLDFVYAGRFREGVELLVRNPGPRDAELLNAFMVREHEDAEGYHLIGMGVRDYVEANPEAPLTPALRAMYEYGFCSMCRYSTVQMMLERGWFPEEIREECRFDADEHIRSLVVDSAA